MDCQFLTTGFKNDYRAAPTDSSEGLSFCLYKGERRVIEYTLWDYKNNQAVDLTGGVLKFSMADGFELPSNRINKESPATITVVDAAAGRFEITFLPTETENIPAKGYVYEISFQDASGDFIGVVLGGGSVKVKSSLSL